MLRHAVLSDAGAIAAVHLAAWKRAYRGVIPEDYLDGLDLRSREEQWVDRLGQGAKVLVADGESGVSGFSSYGASWVDDDSWGELYAIYVHPQYWGRGHGRRLLEATEEGLRALGYGKAHLWVLDTNRGARSFYERLGWVETSMTKVDNIGGVEVTEVRYDRSPLTTG